jgi:septum site-determining protein MinC
MDTVSQAKDANVISLTPNETQRAAELKGSVFTLTVLRIYNTDLDAIEQSLGKTIAQGPRFFANAPVVIDVEQLRENPQAGDLDFAALNRILRKLKLVPVGLRHGDPQQQETAIAAGLAVMQGGQIRNLEAQEATKKPDTKTEPPPEKIAVRDENRAVEDTQRHDTLTVRQPVRAGQQVFAKQGDLVVLSAVNAGAELVADGHIHVYAPLRGRALAGVNGNEQARIFCQSFEAQLVSIAGHYRVFDDVVPKEFFRKPVQIFLDDGQLKIMALK